MLTQPSLAHRAIDLALRQSPEELARQYDVMRKMGRDRRVLTALAFGVATVFLPVWLGVLLYCLDTALEVAGIRLMRALDPPRQPVRYLAMLACYGLVQAVYCTMPVLCWQLDAPLAKAYALGTLLVSLMHVSTVRTVHLPMAVVGWAIISASALGGNTFYWLTEGSVTGFFLTSACAGAVSYFALVTILSVNRLHGDMLRESRAAQAADQAKSRFLAQMSHELRTPLNAILGMGHAELHQASTESGKERLSILVQSAETLSVMLDDILDLSAMQAGQLPIRPRALDLHDEIAGTVAMFRQQVEDADLVLRLSIHDSVPRLAKVDGQRLRQCLSNLLSNAIKYTDEGLITVHAYEAQSGSLAIKVADTGPGVPEDLREKIFEPFWRGQTQVPGTGLGMSIARTLARRMGGDLVLLPSSAGAHFLLTIRVAPASATDLAPPTAGTDAALQGRRVLVVDDIATNRLVAATYLRSLGATPVEAESGPAALEFLTREGADLVLLDLVMPGMDGAATLAGIRALPGAAGRIPVVAMSADTTSQTLHFDGFLRKPLTPERLTQVLRPLMARGPDG